MALILLCSIVVICYCFLSASGAFWLFVFAIDYSTNKVEYKLHRLTERDSRLAHYFALFWGLGLRLGHLATTGATPDVIFLLSDPDFLYG